MKVPAMYVAHMGNAFFNEDGVMCATVFNNDGTIEWTDDNTVQVDSFAIEPNEEVTFRAMCTLLGCNIPGFRGLIRAPCPRLRGHVGQFRPTK